MKYIFIKPSRFWRFINNIEDYFEYRNDFSIFDLALKYQREISFHFTTSIVKNL